jgi:hypothetical protein
MRHTRGPCKAHPRCQPWQAGGDCVARAARGRVGLAAIVRHRMLHIRGPLCAHPAAGRGRRGRSRSTSGTGACSARGDRDPPDAAHTWAARHAFRRRPCQAGRSPRTSGTRTCSARCDCVTPDVAHTWAIQRTSRRQPWQSGAVASHELHGDVLGSRRSRRAGCCAPVGCPAHIPPHPTAGWPQAGAVALHERHWDVLGATCPTFLKGAEENQVELNVLVGTVEAASHSTYGTQRTMEEFHPSVCSKQFVAQAMFRVLDLLAIFPCFIWVYY